eukprot:CAMPEP_0172772226 /NCGR_PEP_ID=MMETSP1074-20121228/191974_1 /TAXON_ID=2916 /ORGANISM="Ceratium fusus, Strain PA161109" /LENGTH=32 /DNA_ID= /DNA_START= /DNA_END= /DNA_ORIENTATION=
MSQRHLHLELHRPPVHPKLNPAHTDTAREDVR